MSILLLPLHCVSSHISSFVNRAVAIIVYPIIPQPPGIWIGFLICFIYFIISVVIEAVCQFLRPGVLLGDVACRVPEDPG